MIDLVDRLLRLAAAMQNDDRSQCEFCFGVTGATEREAATEIARLRAANKALVEAARPIIARAGELPSLAQRRATGCTIDLEHIRALSRAVEAANE